MGDYRVKVIATLSVDENKEKDLIDHIESLKERHKLGEFVTAALRVCWEHPEYLRDSGYRGDTYGMAQERTKFIQGVSVSMNELHRKVDALYDMVLQLRALALVGKKLGLEKKAENSLMAAFIIQKQADELASLLGVSTLQPVWASNKLEIEDKKIDNILETIITSYDGIINEIKELQTVQIVAETRNVDKTIKFDETDRIVENIQESKQKSEDSDMRVAVTVSNVEERVREEVSATDEGGEMQEEVESTMDMSEADWDALDMFVGM